MKTARTTRVKESRKKGLMIICKTECMVISIRDNPRYELQIGDVKIKHEKRFNLTHIGKCELEIQRCIEIGNDAFQKLSNILRNRKKTLSETKKCVLDSFVISILLYGNECWAISSQI